MRWFLYLSAYFERLSKISDVSQGITAGRRKNESFKIRYSDNDGFHGEFAFGVQ